jgi:hypothetical protein
MGPRQAPIILSSLRRGSEDQGLPLLGLAVFRGGSGWVQLIPGLDPGDHGVSKLDKVGVDLAQLLLHLPREVDVALLDRVTLLGDGHVLEEGDDVLLPEDALVFLLQVNEGVASLAVPDVWQASLDTQAQVVADDLNVICTVINTMASLETYAMIRKESN